MITRFIIKQNVKGYWKYLPNPVIGATTDDPCERWPEDPYPARKFCSYDEAEKYLKDACNNQFWGGIFEISKIYISK
jgi:hypothetical protein